MTAGLDLIKFPRRKKYLCGRKVLPKRPLVMTLLMESKGASQEVIAFISMEFLMTMKWSAEHVIQKKFVCEFVFASEVGGEEE